MIYIYVETELLEEVKQAIASEEGLSQLVCLLKPAEHPGDILLRVSPLSITVGLNWQRGIPPYLFTDHLPYHPQNLLGLIFLQLGAYEKASLYLEGYAQIQPILQTAQLLQSGHSPDVAFSDRESLQLSDFARYRHYHNQAVSLHYGASQQNSDFEAVEKSYGQALGSAPDDECFAFTARQLTDLYLDAGRLQQAEELARQAWQRSLSEPAHFALQSSLLQVLLRKLQPPYPKIELVEISVLLKESLGYYEKSKQPLELGMLSMDAAWVAQLKDNFSEGLACINQAIRIFQAEEVPEIEGDAWIRKGTLLYAWAQKGQPFHQQAIDSYRQAQKIYAPQAAPYVHADINHHLALIYSEMPATKEKKSMLYAMASSAFQEALSFFSRAQYPYEYGCICNNFGNAITKFPDSSFQNKLEKAMSYYQEALAVRDADHFPLERATTLLNMLEAYWQIPLDPQKREANLHRWEIMTELVQEIKDLVKENNNLIHEQADEHLRELQKAKQIYA